MITQNDKTVYISNTYPPHPETAETHENYIAKYYNVDWIQGTTDSLPSWISVTDKRQSPIRWYRYMWSSEKGAKIHYGHPNSDKYLLMLPAQACYAYSIDHKKTRDLIENNDLKATRIDFALTTNKPILDLLYADRDKFESTMLDVSKNRLLTDKELSIETWYTGDMTKRRKKGLLRAYDKGKQLGLQTTLHRIELEVGTKHAHKLTCDYATGKPIQSIMLSKFNIKSAWYQDLFKIDETTTQDLQQILHVSNTINETEIQRKMRWIMKQVIPSLNFVIEYDNQNDTQNFNLILSKLKLK